MKIPILPLVALLAFAALGEGCECPPGHTTSGSGAGGTGGAVSSSSTTGGSSSTSSTSTGTTCNPNPTPNPGCPPAPCTAVFACAPHDPPCTAAPNNQCFTAGGVLCGEATVGACVGCCP